MRGVILGVHGEGFIGESVGFVVFAGLEGGAGE